ncbi:cardiolipin synthase [Winogradskyella arenosi]|uniref:Cardiolipin synthase n=1 Tax=Winogradskyella arenosi TaxID=533325 RepID=A0A368ZHW8_9FLAO|nr:cardiolipin synthase [Winogradskyella arenosi]RCW93360.1 cardiolipin synthase [Winogradskyella arenosi]
MMFALIAYVLIAFVLMGRLLLYGVRPTKTLAWLLAIFTIPVGGMLLYFILGRNRKKNKFYHFKKNETIFGYLQKYNALHQSEAPTTPIPPLLKQHHRLAQMMTKSSGAFPTTGNFLQPLKNGPATFDAIFKTLEKARTFIHIQYYIFEEGDLANRFRSLLIQKAIEGVEVRLLYDALGSRVLSKKFIKSLKTEGIQVYGFLPMRLGRFLSSVNYRNHRKIVIIDGLYGFTGGINVSDKYINGDPNLGPWYDMHLQMEGPVIHSLQAVFARDWSFASGTEELLNTKYFAPQIRAGQSTAQVVSSGPDSDFSSIQYLYLSLINKAKNYVYIINPYIIPGEALLETLKIAALSGVDVRLLLSANSDSLLVKWTVRSNFENLLAAGVKIYLYPDGFLHSKVMLSDDELSTIGTANLDIRSFEQNYEVNVLMYDKTITTTLKHDFLNDCKKSQQLNYHQHLQRSKLERLKEGTAKVFSPIL